MSNSHPQNDPPGTDHSIFEPTPDVPVSPAGFSKPASTPGGLTAVCVLAAVLGVVGSLTGCSGLFTQVFASQMQQAMANLPGGANSPAIELQKEMNAKTLAITRRYAWFTIPLLVAKVAVEIVILAGAIMSWGLKPRGRSWLRAGLIAAIVVESLQIVPTLKMQHETFEVMGEFMPKMLAAQPGAQNHPAGMGGVMSTMSTAMGIVSMIIAVGWLAAKLVYYVLSIRYLRKPSIVALFEPNT